ncbi:glycosyltransferase [Luteolibacter algae]|uniref:Glycosyltransferase n=1 Tax=Luteolibacter algae TaxID=454151 RepID=A0ABW5D7P7_9BACT
MPHFEPLNRLETDGKFFRYGDQRLWLRCVTYGPFPPGKTPDSAVEFEKISQAGFNAIRTFSLPGPEFLDAAQTAGLLVFAGLSWRHYEDFGARPRLLSSAKIQLTEWLGDHASHPALTGVYVGNEIPAELARWIGPDRVRRVIESLISLGKRISPHLLFAYANYPSTEYLEPGNADFSAFNIYLEDRAPFTDYLRRLQNIAGDRPLVISEFGLDTARNSQQRQAEVFTWALETSYLEETAGFTVYSWSDLWQNNGREVLDWDFGLVDRAGVPKQALSVCQSFEPPSISKPSNSYSIIVCTRNGAERISGCLLAIRNLVGGPYETLVINDGSTDDTATIVSEKFPGVRLLNLPPSGLSAARNVGAAAANGNILAFTDDDCEPDREWIVRLDRAFKNPEIDAAGGPNLPPVPRTVSEAVICSAPGAPSHVLLSDTRAEHLPGCNISVRREAFEEIGGFDPVFKTAGDDVDFCWRLRDAGFQLGFVPGAFVWHWRRPSIQAFLRQQKGYGIAERLLIKKHPERFSATGEARWDGFIYGGGPVRAERDSIIYHGSMGQAGYQSIVNRMLPLRPIAPKFRSPRSEALLKLVNFLQPLLRRWSRNRQLRFILPHRHDRNSPEVFHEFHIAINKRHFSRDSILEDLLRSGWNAAGPTETWDLKKDGDKLLLATEILDHEHINLLFRIAGNHTNLESQLREQISGN